jgi:hypothetical protein
LRLIDTTSTWGCLNGDHQRQFQKNLNLLTSAVTNQTITIVAPQLRIRVHFPGKYFPKEIIGLISDKDPAKVDRVRKAITESTELDHSYSRPLCITAASKQIAR